MIIDEEAQFRALLMHHVTTFWPDAIISAYDPTVAGPLPDEFSGAGNDLVPLGSRHGDRDGVDVLQRFLKQKNFPPIVYFGTEEDEGEPPPPPPVALMGLPMLRPVASPWPRPAPSHRSSRRQTCHRVQRTPVHTVAGRRNQRPLFHRPDQLEPLANHRQEPGDVQFREAGSAGRGL